MELMKKTGEVPAEQREEIKSKPKLSRASKIERK
jgi:hypothetical protein